MGPPSRLRRFARSARSVADPSAGRWVPRGSRFRFAKAGRPCGMALCSPLARWPRSRFAGLGRASLASVALHWPRSPSLASLAFTGLARLARRFAGLARRFAGLARRFAGLARLRWPSLASVALRWPRSRFAPASLASEKLAALAVWRLLAAGGWPLAARSCSAAWRLLGRASLASLAASLASLAFAGLGRASLARASLARASLARASLASLVSVALRWPRPPSALAVARASGGPSLPAMEVAVRSPSLAELDGWRQFARGRSRFALRSPRSRLRTGSESLATLAGRWRGGPVRWRRSPGQSLAKRLAGDSRGLVAKVRDSLVTLVESSRRRATGRRVSCAHHEWLGLAGETRALGAGGRDWLVSLVRSVRAVGTRRRELRVHPGRSRLAREASTLSAR